MNTLLPHVNVADPPVSPLGRKGLQEQLKEQDALFKERRCILDGFSVLERFHTPAVDQWLHIDPAVTHSSPR